MVVVVTPDRSITISDHDLSTVSAVSRRAAQEDYRMSDNEFNAAAIVNGQLNDIGEDFRRAFVKMGREWSHACVEAIFNNWELEMTLGPDNPACPVGVQRIFTLD